MGCNASGVSFHFRNSGKVFAIFADLNTEIAGIQNYRFSTRACMLNDKLADGAWCA
jgi:hypothetical protein